MHGLFDFMHGGLAHRTQCIRFKHNLSTLYTQNYGLITFCVYQDLVLSSLACNLYGKPKHILHLFRHHDRILLRQSFEI